MRPSRPRHGCLMNQSPGQYRRRSIRLPGYNYRSPGAYFITICTHGRACLFGEVAGGDMQLTQYGRIVQDEWSRTTVIRDHVTLDTFTVMPNHVHGIIIIGGQFADPGVGAHGCAPLCRGPKSLGSIVAGFKSAATKRINEIRSMPGTPVWQRNYYEHVIRSDADLDRVRRYIVDNPAKWAEDPENPHNVRRLLP